jgi:transposase
MSRHISGDKIVVVETRRRWSADERHEAVKETLTASVSSVARKRGIAKSLLFRWRKVAGLSGKRSGARKPAPSFVPVALPAPALRAASSESPSTHTPACGVIEIELSGGRRLRLSGPVDVEALKRVIAVLDGR